MERETVAYASNPDNLATHDVADGEDDLSQDDCIQQMHDVEAAIPLVPLQSQERNGRERSATRARNARTPNPRSSCRPKHDARLDRCRVFGCIVSCLLPLVLPAAITSVVFFPWFFASIYPDMAWEASMHRTQCYVLNHTVIDTRPVAGGMALAYLPGIQAQFSATSKDHITTTYEAVVRPRMQDADSWMGRDVMNDYFERHPIGSRFDCFYQQKSDMQRRPFVVTRMGVDGIGERLVPCILFTILAFVVSTTAAVSLAGLICCCIRDPDMC